MASNENIILNYNDQDIHLSAKLRLINESLIIFMHGFGCAKECFDAAFSADGLKNFSICTFDFPGHGNSSRASASTYSLQFYADIVNMLIDLISPTKVSMVCHSMGGAVGLIATQGRRNLDVFVNVEGNLVAEDCGIVSRGIARQSHRAFTRQGFKKFLDGLRASDRDGDQAWAPWYAQADPAALHESARSLVEWSDTGKLLDLFEGLKDKSYVYGTSDSKSYLLQHLNGISSYAIPESGHFVMLDNPRAFYSLLPELLHQAPKKSRARTVLLPSRGY
jgi:pimeloyl-ACP methyl ester carboxylesterase